MNDATMVASLIAPVPAPESHLAVVIEFCITASEKDWVSTKTPINRQTTAGAMSSCTLLHSLRLSCPHNFCQFLLLPTYKNAVSEQKKPSEFFHVSRVITSYLLASYLCILHCIFVGSNAGQATICDHERTHNKNSKHK
jgi:hypothetical protein